MIADQSGSGKTLAYLLPLLQLHVLSADPEDTTLKLIAWVPKDAQQGKEGPSDPSDPGMKDDGL